MYVSLARISHQALVGLDFLEVRTVFGVVLPGVWSLERRLGGLGLWIGLGDPDAEMFRAQWVGPLVRRIGVGVVVGMRSACQQRSAAQACS